MTVSCIIPAYNEELTLANLIKKIRRVKAIDDVVVVDDGSTDNTFLVASKFAKVIRHKKNRGKGAAMKTGMKYIKGNIVVFLDADIQNFGKLQVSRINKMISLIEDKNADVVIGTFDFQCFQTFTELVYKPLMGLLFPEVMLKINKGFLSGQRAIKKSVFDKLSLGDGFDVETSMNLELCFLKPAPKIKFIHLGKIDARPKGYQDKMKTIASCILKYGKKHNRLHHLKRSSFKRIAGLLYDVVK